MAKAKTKSVTGSQIEQLRDAAALAGDERLVAICECAMFGRHQPQLGLTRDGARAICADAITHARPMGRGGEILEFLIDDMHRAADGWLSDFPASTVLEALAVIVAGAIVSADIDPASFRKALSVRLREMRAIDREVG